MKKNILIICALGLLWLGSLLHAKSQKYDVLVYGAARSSAKVGRIGVKQSTVISTRENNETPPPHNNRSCAGGGVRLR